MLMQSLVYGFFANFWPLIRRLIIISISSILYSLIYNQPLSAQPSSNSSINESLNEGYFFAQNPDSELSSDDEEKLKKDSTLLFKALSEELNDPQIKEEVSSFLEENPLDLLSLPDNPELKPQLQLITTYQQAYRLYHKAIKYLEQQKEKYRQEELDFYREALEDSSDLTEEEKQNLISSYQYEDIEFKKHLNHHLFVYYDSESKSYVDIFSIDGVLVYAVYPEQTPSTVYNFYIYNENQSSMKVETKKKFRLFRHKAETHFEKQFKHLTAKQRMNKFNTISTLLDNDHRIIGLNRNNFPLFNSTPLKYLKEYFTSIYEDANIPIGIFCTDLQLLVTSAFQSSIYEISTKDQMIDSDNLSLKLIKHALLIVHVTIFGLVISSNAGTYRNFIDSSKKFFPRFLKDTFIGLMFAYPFAYLSGDLTLSQMATLSLACFAFHFNIYFVTFFNKVIKYPITYIVRTLDKFGYYGQNGDRMFNFFGLQLKVKNLHNQLLYNLVSFGLKIGALIGFTVTVNNIDIPAGKLLFTFAPLLALIANNKWIKSQYTKGITQYLSHPSSALRISLKRKEEAFEDHLKFLRKFKTPWYTVMGFILGPDYINRKIDSIYEDSGENDISIDSLTDACLKQMSIKQLSEIITFYEGAVKDKDSVSVTDQDVLDQMRLIIAKAKIIRLRHIYKLNSLRRASKILQTRSIPTMVNTSIAACAALFTTQN